MSEIIEALGFEDAFTDEERSAIDSAKVNLKDELAKSNSPIVDDFFVLRFLRARDMDVGKGTEMLRACLKWRAENGVDSILENPPLKTDAASYKFHREDKDGQAVIVGQWGKLAPMLIRNVTLEEFRRVAIWQCEVLEHKQREQSRKLGRRIYKMNMLIDLSDVNSSAFKTRKLSRMALRIALDNYPERLQCTYFFNCNWIVSKLWSFAKRLVDEKTLAKMKMYQDCPTDELLQIIDEDKLPTVFGGKCDCSHQKGGCIPLPDYSVPPGGDESAIEEIVVRAGQRQSREHVVSTDGYEVIYFSTCSYDIDFTASFIDENGTKHEVHKEERVRGDVPVSGTFKSTSSGRMTFIWSNEYSIWTSKTVKFSCSVLESDEEN